MVVTYKECWVCSTDSAIRVDVSPTANSTIETYVVNNPSEPKYKTWIKETIMEVQV